MMGLLSYLPVWGRSEYEPVEGDTLKDDSIAGIYAITNMVTREQYIGSSGDIPQRFKQHRWLLQRGLHHAKRLQKAWQAHGESNFQFEVMEQVADLRLLSMLEQTYFDASRPAYNGAAMASNNSVLPPVSMERWCAVVAELYDGHPDIHTPLHSAIKEAIMVGALRPGPNFHLLLNVEAAALALCR
jgi:hypothetical protein